MQLLGEGPPSSMEVGRTVQAEATACAKALSLEQSLRERGRDRLKSVRKHLVCQSQDCGHFLEFKGIK